MLEDEQGWRRTWIVRRIARPPAFRRCMYVLTPAMDIEPVPINVKSVVATPCTFLRLDAAVS